MQRYNVTGPRPVLGHAPGEQFDHLLSAEDEAAHIAAGRLEIVPRGYRVIGPRNVFGNGPGSEFEAALTIDQEAALLGVHLERVDEEPTENLSGKKREELDELAAALGIENPDQLPNKDAVIEAIEAAQNPDEETKE